MPRKKVAKKQEVLSKKKVKAIFARERVITEDSGEAKELYNQSRFGSMLDDGKVQLSLFEALYLIEKKKLDVMDYRPELYTMIESNEAHIRLMSGTYQSLKYNFWPTMF